MLAPEIGRDLGIAPKLVGVFVGVLYAGSMIASLASGMFIERHGPIRVSQACVLLCATGALLVAGGPILPGGAVLALAVAPLIIGIGYGPITPASSQILARTAPPSRMALTFSIKQTGVPAGAALAGAALPDSRVVVRLACGVRAGRRAGRRRRIGRTDHARGARCCPNAGAHADRGRHLRSAPRARCAVARCVELVVVAFIYASLQVCLTSFIVVYLTESLGITLVAAGLVLTAANIGGIVGRIAWGGFADLHLAPRQLLGLARIG